MDKTQIIILCVSIFLVLIVVLLSALIYFNINKNKSVIKVKYNSSKENSEEEINEEEINKEYDYDGPVFNIYKFFGYNENENNRNCRKAKNVYESNVNLEDEDDDVFGKCENASELCKKFAVCTNDSEIKSGCSVSAYDEHGIETKMGCPVSCCKNQYGNSWNSESSENEEENDIPNYTHNYYS